ncbi:hypothetical protein HanIR_Chr06g0291261 [Helianthus annuus]|nr:hypothetical protein HanIR_Chr06g0291261 [Helianthus annuus]
MLLSVCVYCGITDIVVCVVYLRKEVILMVLLKMKVVSSYVSFVCVLFVGVLGVISRRRGE